MQCDRDEALRVREGKTAHGTSRAVVPVLPLIKGGAWYTLALGAESTILHVLSPQLTCLTARGVAADLCPLRRNEICRVAVEVLRLVCFMPVLGG